MRMRGCGYQGWFGKEGLKGREYGMERRDRMRGAGHSSPGEKYVDW